MRHFCINELVEYAVPDDPLNTYLWTISGGTIVGPDNQSTVYVIWDVAMTGGDFLRPAHGHRNQPCRMQRNR